MSDSNDADASIGIGLTAVEGSNGDQGAGWTNCFNSNSCKGRQDRQVWIYVEKVVDNWTPVMKIISASTVFGYNSKYWTDSKTLNPDSPISEAKDAKYHTFSSVPFHTIRMCVGSMSSNCVVHSFPRTYNSARELFSSGYVRDATLDQEGFYQAYGVVGHRECGMQVKSSLCMHVYQYLCICD